MADTAHTYPSRYPPGKHWALDAAWEILDVLKPGVLDADVRALLAGMITSKLVQERKAARMLDRP